MDVYLKEDFIRSLDVLANVDVKALVASLRHDSPEVSVKFNRRKPIAQNSSLYEGMQPVSWCKDGFYLPSRPVFTLNPLLHAGAFYVQDASSMVYGQIMERLAAGRQSLKVLDFCAAPGGKTTSIINAVPDGSLVVANEFTPARAKILCENLEKWGYQDIIITSDSSSSYARLGEYFDIIAVDAPCSGEGMMRKDEDARRQWSPALVQQCASLQKEIVEDMVNCLNPGGYLLYSTCTFNTAEDEGVCRFLMDECGMENVSLSLEGVEDASPAECEDIGGLRFIPGSTRGEGLFVALFRKPPHLPTQTSNSAPAAVPTANANAFPYSVSNLTTNNIKRGNKKHERKSRTQSLSLNLEAPNLKEIQNWFSVPMHFTLKGNSVYGLPAAQAEALAHLSSAGIKVISPGLPVAEVKGKLVLPDSRVVLYQYFNRHAFPHVELSESEALKYLRRELASCPQGTPNGYISVGYQGENLGLMKNIGSRANNLYPLHWRIRMQ